MNNKDNSNTREKENKELYEQIERGNLFTHTSLSRHSVHINEIDSFLYAVIDILIKKGITSQDELHDEVVKIQNEMMQKGEMAFPGVVIRIDSEKEENYNPVNCEERISICKAVCCKLDFMLSIDEIESGNVKWDLGRPYHIRKLKDCYCSHLDLEKKGCSVYNNRPAVCKKYSCEKDERIWKDFDKMILNEEWIKDNIVENKIRLNSAPMFPEQQVSNPHPEPIIKPKK